MLDPDLREAARQLIATGRVRSEVDPEQYRAAVKGRKELAEFFRAELGWTLEVLEVAELVRLHKRRADVPADRGPRLQREGRDGPLASATVLMLTALVCEQLWRRPRMSLRELLQAIAQVCASEALSGRLPHFRIVASDGTAKKEAHENRRHLVDALKLLVAEGSIVVDADLDRAVTDEESDLVVSASRARLAAKFSSLSPTLLGLEELSPQLHAAALSAESLLDHAATEDPAPSVEDRRLKAIRRVVDDPATDPLDDDSAGTPYLHSLTGRERALTVTASLRLAATVRRDWWEVTDTSGLGTGIDFPTGRRTERQAALALLAVLARRQDPAAPLPIAEVIALFEGVRDGLPRWAAAYKRHFAALARAAAAELVSAGLLSADPEHPDRWKPTLGVHLWRVRVRQAPTTVPQSGHQPQHARPADEQPTALPLAGWPNYDADVHADGTPKSADVAEPNRLPADDQPRTR